MQLHFSFTSQQGCPLALDSHVTRATDAAPRGFPSWSWLWDVSQHAVLGAGSQASTALTWLEASRSAVPARLIMSLSSQLSFQHKIGILYCKAGQSTEEEMYNNETAGPAFEEFLDLLGQRVRLKGFSKYRAQLDNKSKHVCKCTLLCVCMRVQMACVFV